MSGRLVKVDVCGDCRLYKNGASPEYSGYCDLAAKCGRMVQAGTLACASFKQKTR